MPVSDNLRRSLEAAGQDHLLTFADRLDEGRLASLLGQIQTLDLGAMQELVKTYVHATPAYEIPDDADALLVIAPARPLHEEARASIARASCGSRCGGSRERWTPFISASAG